MSQLGELNKFIKVLDTKSFQNDKFKLTRFRTEFAVENVQEASNPDEILRNCIQYSIDQTRKKSREENMEVDRIGVNISSTLLDYDICSYTKNYRKHDRCNT